MSDDVDGQAGQARQAGQALWLVGVVSCLSWIPLFSAPFVVMQDLSAHLETAAQLRDLLWGERHLAGLYQVQSWPFPNSVPVLLLALLHEVLDPLLAAKLLLAASAVLWPLSLGFLARALGRSPALALLAIPSIFDLSWSYGFFNFILGKPMLVVALLLAVRGSRKETGMPVLAALAALLLLLFCTHLLLFSFAMALALWFVVVMGQGLLARARAVAAILVGGAPGLHWMFVHRQQNAGAVTLRPLAQSLRSAWGDLGDLFVGAADAVSWWGAAAAAVVVVIVSVRAGRLVFGRTHLALAGAGLFLLGFWAFGPVRTPLVSIVAERFLSPALALLVLLPPLRVLSRWILLGLVLCVATTFLVTTTATAQRYRAFSNKDMGEFRELLQKMPPGASVATHYVTPFSEYGRHNATWHWPKLHAVYGGGITDDSFAYRVTTWVTLTDEARRAGAIKRHNLDPVKLKEWDYLLVRGRSPAVENLLGRAPLALVGETGTWRLYMITQ